MKVPTCGNPSQSTYPFSKAKKAILYNLGESLKEMMSSQEKVH